MFVDDNFYGIIGYHVDLFTSKETLTYRLEVISSLALYEYPSNVGGIVDGCEPRTFSEIHRWKHEDWISMT